MWRALRRIVRIDCGMDDELGGRKEEDNAEAQSSLRSAERYALRLQIVARKHMSRY